MPVKSKLSLDGTDALTLIQFYFISIAPNGNSSSFKRLYVGKLKTQPLYKENIENPNNHE